MNHTNWNRLPLPAAVGGQLPDQGRLTTPKSATSGTPCATASNIANLILPPGRSSPTATAVGTSYAATSWRGQRPHHAHRPDRRRHAGQHRLHAATGAQQRVLPPQLPRQCVTIVTQVRQPRRPRLCQPIQTHRRFPGRRRSPSLRGEGWPVIEDAGAAGGVVASPAPVEIIEQQAIAEAAASGWIVIAPAAAASLSPATLPSRAACPPSSTRTSPAACWQVARRRSAAHQHQRRARLPPLRHAATTRHRTHDRR